jgi:hypothetical protein
MGPPKAVMPKADPPLAEKTVVPFEKNGEVPEWFNGAVSKTVVP